MLPFKFSIPVILALLLWENAGILSFVPTILTLLAWLVISTMFFATLRAQGNENSRRISRLEETPNVSLQQYREGQEFLKQRLDRIERKLDGRQ